MTTHHPVTDAVSASREVNPLVKALSLEARPQRPGPVATSLAARIPDDDDAPQRAAALLPELQAAGVRVAEFSLGQPSLDEVFLALTGQRTAEETEQEEVAS